jgi:hypothetical protein
VLLAGAAFADAPSVHVAYAAPAGCSSREHFVRELSLRSPRVRVVETPEPAATIVVELADRGAGVRGEIRFTEVDGTETRRAIAGATCEEVVPALALIAAVLVDPQAVSRPPSTATASPAPAPKPSWRVRPSVSGGATLTSVVGPGLGFGPWFELGLAAERGGRRGPSLGIAVAHFENPTHSTAIGAADFSTTLGRLSVCPVRWPVTGPVFGSACGAFEAGAVHAAGSQTVNRHSYSEPWFALAPVLGLEYRPLPFLGLRLDGLAVFPLVRDRYYFGPDTEVYSVPVVGVTGEAGLTVVWP